MYNTKVSTN